MPSPTPTASPQSLSGLLPFVKPYKGRIALAGLFLGEHERWGKPLRWTVVFLAAMTSFAGAYTANFGGKIRHTEIRTDVGPANALPDPTHGDAHEKDDHTEH